MSAAPLLPPAVFARKARSIPALSSRRPSLRQAISTTTPLERYGTTQLSSVSTARWVVAPVLAVDNITPAMAAALLRSGLSTRVCRSRIRSVFWYLLPDNWPQRLPCPMLHTPQYYTNLVRAIIQHGGEGILTEAHLWA